MHDINDDPLFITMHLFVIAFVSFVGIEPFFRFEKLNARFFLYSLLKLLKPQQSLIMRHKVCKVFNQDAAPKHYSEFRNNVRGA